MREAGHLIHRYLPVASKTLATTDTDRPGMVRFVVGRTTDPRERRDSDLTSERFGGCICLVTGGALTCGGAKPTDEA
jgi:hypothetical protein